AEDPRLDVVELRRAQGAPAARRVVGHGAAVDALVRGQLPPEVAGVRIAGRDQRHAGQLVARLAQALPDVAVDEIQALAWARARVTAAAVELQDLRDPPTPGDAGAEHVEPLRI